MKKVTAFLLMLLFASSSFAQTSIWFNGTYDDAKAKAQQENKLIFIDFFKTG